MQTVADLSPSELHGIIVIALLSVWLFFKALDFWGAYDWRGRMILVVAIAALVGVPVINGLIALSGPLAASVP